MNPLQDVTQLLHREPRAEAAESQPNAPWILSTLGIVEPTLVRRVPDSASSAPSSSSSCTPGSKSNLCQYDSNSTNLTLPIALGVTLPVTVALIILIYLHQRNKRRQRIEDDNDKLGSLDFGLGEAPQRTKGKRGKRAPQPIASNIDEKMLRSRGLSLDLGSPYVLPGGLHESRGSLHSLSRSARDSQGPYASIHLAKSPDSQSLHSTTFQSRTTSRKDASSVMTGSSESTTAGMKVNLLRHAHPLSRGTPPNGSAPNTPPSSSPPRASPITVPEPVFVAPRKTVEINHVVKPNLEASNRLVREGSDKQGAFVLPPRTDSKPPTMAISSSPVVEPTSPTLAEDVPQEPRRSLAPLTPSTGSRLNRSSPRVAPMEGGRIPSPPAALFDDSVTYADVLGIVQKESRSPVADRVLQFPPMPTIPEPNAVTGLGVQGLQFGTRRLQAGLRPLPPHDPSENAELRANKIRSFYREYFDESNEYHATYARGYDYDYYEGYGQEHLDGAAIYDPETGHFIISGAPYSSPITRRAMTPPPRAPPRFRNSPLPSGQRSNASSAYGPQVRGPRAYSTASARPATGARGRAHSRLLPPPSPLTNLGTPYLLTNDSAILSPVDFAPPMSWRDRQAGKPVSPYAQQQPYHTPSVRAFTPLVSSFDDLSIMPSPHALRKSGSFTALDFAMPPRFKSSEGASSDTGSVRSGRSNISAAQLAHIRAGAYRVSRIPKEMVGTRDDFAITLKPSWEQRA